MLWIGSCEVFYAAVLGGLIGAVWIALAFKQALKNNMKLIEHYWQTDIKTLNGLISEQERKLTALKLSPNSVGKAVKNPGFYRGNKGES